MIPLSIIGKLFGWTKLPQWVLELIAIGLVVITVWLIHLHTLHVGVREGVARQQTQDNEATAALERRVAGLQAKMKAMADAAKVTYDQEHASNVADATAPVGASQLCQSADTHDSQSGVRAARTTIRRIDGTAAAAPVGRPVSAPDPGLPPDRRRLLGALAALFDDQTAIVRQYQARETGQP